MTTTAGEESELAWAPDSRRLAYVSHRDGTDHLFLYDFGTGKETQLTSGAARDNVAALFARRQNGSRSSGIRASCASSIRRRRQRRLVATGVFDTPPFFDAARFRLVAGLAGSSPICPAGAKTFQNISVVPVGGRRGASGDASCRTPTRGSLSWSPDGTYLTFDDGAAHGAGRRHPRRPDSAHAEVPRGSVPRSVQGRAAEDAAEPPRRPPSPPPASPPARTARAGRRPRRRRPPAKPVEDRVRRHPPPRQRAAGRRGRRRGRTSAPTASGCCSPRRRPASRICTCSRSTSCRASRRSRGSSPRRPAPSAARSSRPTARRSTTSIAAASSTYARAAGAEAPSP